MATPAGQLTRRVTFLRRATAPTVPNVQRSGYVAYGLPEWAAYKDGRPRERTIGGWTLQVKTGVLMVRMSPVMADLTFSDRVRMDGEDYEIVNVHMPPQPDGMVGMELMSAPTRVRYGRELEQHGETVNLRRSALPTFQVRAIVMGYRPDELVGGINQGDRRVLVAAEDVEASGFPVPFRDGQDRVIVRGKSLIIAATDDSTHRSGGVLNAYELRVSGA